MKNLILASAIALSLHSHAKHHQLRLHKQPSGRADMLMSKPIIQKAEITPNREFIIHFKYGSNFPTNTHIWYLMYTTNLINWNFYPESNITYLTNGDISIPMDMNLAYFRIWKP